MHLAFKCKKSELSTAIERVCEIKNISIESEKELVRAVDLLLFTMKAKGVSAERDSQLENENLTINLFSDTFENEEADDDDEREANDKMEFIQIVKCLQKEILNPKTE